MKLRNGYEETSLHNFPLPRHENKFFPMCPAKQGSNLFLKDVIEEIEKRNSLFVWPNGNLLLSVPLLAECLRAAHSEGDSRERICLSPPDVDFGPLL